MRLGLQVLLFDWEPGTRSMGHLDVGGTAGTTARWLPLGGLLGASSALVTRASAQGSRTANPKAPILGAAIPFESKPETWNGSQLRHVVRYHCCSWSGFSAPKVGATHARLWCFLPWPHVIPWVTRAAEPEAYATSNL